MYCSWPVFILRPTLQSSLVHDGMSHDLFVDVYVAICVIAWVVDSTGISEQLTSLLKDL